MVMIDPEFVSDFELVWQAFPRKVGKGAARRAWNKLNPDAATVQKMLDALSWQVKQPQWVKDGGQFIPHFSTWLHGERWDDEPFHTTTDRRDDRLQGLRDFIDG